jgi:hypothetical protein
MKRAKLGPGARRVWLALPELEYARLLLDARALHESPNLFVSGILRERWYADDEREAIRSEDDQEQSRGAEVRGLARDIQAHLRGY